MITADALARELGCTLSDLEELDRLDYSINPLKPHDQLTDATASILRRAWSKRTEAAK